MQMIPRIKLCPQPLRRRGIPHRRVKVDYGIVPPRGADPLVHALPRLLPLGVRVRLVGAGEGRDGRAEDGDAEAVQACGDLVEGEEEAVADGGLRGGVVGRDADVVDALEDHGVAHASVGDDVAVETAQGVGAEAVGEDAVAARGLVDDGDVPHGGGGGVGGMQAREEAVRPAVVGVGGRAAAVADGIADDGDRRGGALGDLGLDGADEVPVVRRGGVAAEVLVGDAVAGGEEGGGAGAGVAGDAVGGLAVGEVDCDGDDGVGVDGEVNGVREDDGAVGDGEGAAAGEGDDLEGGGVDGARAGRVVRGAGDCDSRDGEVGAPEDVAYLEAQGGRGQGELDCLAEGCVVENAASFVLQSVRR